jgi:hypothetical protein
LRRIARQPVGFCNGSIFAADARGSGRGYDVGMIRRLAWQEELAIVDRTMKVIS